MLTAFLSIALPLAGRSSEPQEGCASHRAIQTNKEQQKKKRAKLRRNAKVDVDHRLDLGERIYTFLRNISVDEAKKYESTFLRDLSEGYQPTAVLPYGFWGNFFQDRDASPERCFQAASRRASSAILFATACHRGSDKDRHAWCTASWSLSRTQAQSFASIRY